MTTLYLSGAININSWHARKEDLQRAFPIDVSMVPSSAIIVATDGEHLTCGGFSLGETSHLGIFKFITDYFGGLSHTPRRGNEGATFMGATSSEASTPWWATIEDSTEEFLMASSRKGSFSLLSPGWHGGFTRSCDNQ
jgi:hypothetical protein